MCRVITYDVLQLWLHEVNEGAKVSLNACGLVYAQNIKQKGKLLETCKNDFIE